jgi:sterol desaturase/sphingolipid hydroxylase (fatty acid hydroxylase superfamily)
MTLASKRFLLYVAVLVLAMALLSLVEAVLPLRARGKANDRRSQVNWTLTILVFALNWLLPAPAAFVGLIASPSGLAGRLTSSVSLRVLASIVILDLFTYAAHVSMHRVPMLWRFHRVHHCDPFVDVSTTYRFHPLETLWRFTWTLVPGLLLGLPAEGIVAYRLLSAINGLLEHTNLSIGGLVDRALSWIVVTPNMHKVHHSMDRRDTDSNYGNIFAVYDRLFRTFSPGDRAHRVVYGLRGVHSDRASSLLGVLTLPFESSHPPTPAPPQARDGTQS